MKLLIVTPIFPPRTGGPSTYVWDIVSRLKAEHDITIICFSPQPKQLPGATIISIPETGSSLSRQIKLAVAVVRYGWTADTIYIQGALVVGFTTAIIAWLMRKRSLLRFVGDEVWETQQLQGQTNARLDVYYRQPKTLKEHSAIFCQRLCLSLVSGIVTPAKSLQQFLSQTHRVQTNKIHRIPNAVTPLTRKNVRKQKYQLVTVGRLVPWKHIDLIIKAVDLARRQHPWQLYIIGEGPEKSRLTALVNRLRAQSWVHFSGRLSREHTQKYIAHSQKLILYSTYEGLSHTLLEAMLERTPIIASNITANQDTIEATGVLVTPKNIHALSKAINKPSPDPKPAYQLAINRYNWEQHIIKLRKIL